jgi:two-component system osmolarity sensor histidine kinase EnvZ
VANGPPKPGAALPSQNENLLPSDHRGGFGLFGRTFFLLAALLLVSILAWLQTLRVFELEPRAVQTAQQIASIVNLSRAALIHSDSIARVSLIKTMTEQEAVRILPREPGDRYEPFPQDGLGLRMTLELEARLGADTVVATSVNDEPGLWIGFTIDEDRYWMLTDQARLNPPVGKTWIIWLVTATALSLAGAALIAGLINRPLRDLSVAAGRIREGDFAAGQLDETVAANEIREVNIEFNRMSRKLAQIEKDRVIMLAGISHDLRTPLARLRLETELSVSDEAARSHMATDIDQVNAIINKFMDYARPDQIVLTPIALLEVVNRCSYALKDAQDVALQVDVPDDILVMADEVDLVRVITNLLENACRYGRSADNARAEIEIVATASDTRVVIALSDRGPGASPDHLEQLTTVFFRGDSARTSATGAGLGLAIVEKNIQRMGGTLLLRNRDSGGLSVRIELNRARKAA